MMSWDYLSSHELEARLDQLRDEMHVMEQKVTLSLNEIKSQVMRSSNEGKKLAVRMDITEQTLVEHDQALVHQNSVNEYLLKEALESKQARLKSMSADIESMKTMDIISGRLALLEESREQLLAKRAGTGGETGSRSNARTDSDVQLEKRPCRKCGALLSAKYLRKARAKHEQTMRCKKAADAAAAAAAEALFDQGPESPHCILDVRTLEGPPIIIEIQECDDYSLGYTLPQDAV